MTPKKDSGFLNLSHLKVALVYDRVNKWGGAERVLLSLRKIFPQAPLFTLVYDPQGAPWAKSFSVHPSFVQFFPWAKKHHELYAWLAPLAFESFDFRGFDLVISVTSAEAKGVLTLPQTCHLCYCLTPTRYLWSDFSAYRRYPGFGWGLNFFAPWLKRWDRVAASRPDTFLAISAQVKRRLSRYYQRPSSVVFPPVDSFWFSAPFVPPEDYFLVVSRLVPYKKIDLVVRVFNDLGWPLKIVGTGREEVFLHRLAKPNIQFLGRLTDRELIGYYGACKAVICPQEEDFGLVPLEAQACGRPVIAFRGGGITETVVAGRTGEFFSPQTGIALKKLLLGFRPSVYRPSVCRRQAARFAEASFLINFQKELVKIWTQFPANK